MATYTVTPALPALVFVNNSDFPAERPWDGVTAIYEGDPSKPLRITGPFDLPPYVQAAVSAHFVEVYSQPELLRNSFATNKGPFVIPAPEATPREPDDGEPKEA